ncbi:15004_t:CDS:2, partial [Rhizophagus irregularis]
TSATIESGVVNNYLCAIDKEKQDSLKQRMNILDKKIMYALQKKSRSLRLIEILENFTNEDSSDDEVESDDEFEEELDDVDDRNNEEGFQLQNPKIR